MSRPYDPKAESEAQDAEREALQQREEEAIYKLLGKLDDEVVLLVEGATAGQILDAIEAASLWFARALHRQEGDGLLVFTRDGFSCGNEQHHTFAHLTLCMARIMELWEGADKDSPGNIGTPSELCHRLCRFVYHAALQEPRLFVHVNVMENGQDGTLLIVLVDPKDRVENPLERWNL